MQTLQNVHHQFAEFFKSEALKPFAFLVSKKLSEGHICINLEDAASQLVDTPYDQGEWRRIDPSQLKEEPLVTVKDGPKQPFVLHNDRLYLQRYFYYETAILQRIKAFVQKNEDKNAALSKELQSRAAFVNSLFDRFLLPGKDIHSDTIDWQLVAAVSAVLNDFTIITGGPGTGKTTTVAKILAILYSVYPDLSVALAAPTGKAAMRMAESLKASWGASPGLAEKFQALAPGTIHRL